MKNNRSQNVVLKSLRFFDISISISALALLAPVLIGVYGINSLNIRRPLFVQRRLGKGGKPFLLIKFRTLPENTPDLLTHSLVVEPSCFGAFLRRTKIDELPQLFNVLMGEMSLVGPRPGLCSDSDLKNARLKRGVFDVLPGITGIAQVAGYDMSDARTLAKVDQLWVKRISARLYFRLIFRTLFGSRLC